MDYTTKGSVQLHGFADFCVPLKQLNAGLGYNWKIPVHVCDRILQHMLNRLIAQKGLG